MPPPVPSLTELDFIVQFFMVGDELFPHEIPPPPNDAERIAGL